MARQGVYYFISFWWRLQEDLFYLFFKNVILFYLSWRTFYVLFYNYWPTSACQEAIINGICLPFPFSSSFVPFFSFLCYSSFSLPLVPPSLYLSLSTFLTLSINTAFTLIPFFLFLSFSLTLFFMFCYPSSLFLLLSFSLYHLTPFFLRPCSIAFTWFALYFSSLYTLHVPL